MIEVRHNGLAVAGEVSWSQGERFGLKCPSPIDFGSLHDCAPDQRVGRRSQQRVAVRIAAEFVLRDDAFTVLITDISETGARVYMPQSPRVGIKGALLWGDHERAGAVLWSSGDVFGLAFDEPLPSGDVLRARASGSRRKVDFDFLPWPKPHIPAHLRAATAFDRRRRQRASIGLDCEIRQGSEPWLPARLEDVSQEGFRLAWFPGCRVAEPLILRLPDGQAHSADILWRDNHMIACQFAAPLRPAALKRVVVR